MRKTIRPAMLLLTIAIVALGMKVALTLNMHRAVETEITPPVEIGGFRYLGSRKATAQGPYRMFGYSGLHCDGSIVLLPLYRNAEGAALLARLTPDGINQRGYIFQGQIFKEYPQLHYSIAWVYHQLFRALQSENTELDSVFAFAEKGDCELAAKLSVSL